MLIKVDITVDTETTRLSDLNNFVEGLKIITGNGQNLIVSVVETKAEKPEKVKPVKPEKVVTPTPDTKVTGTPDVKDNPAVETKPNATPDSKPVFDLSTDDKIEEAKVQLRLKTASLNAAGFMDFTRKAVNKCGNASSITKMEAKYIDQYWDMLTLIENGQTDQI